MADIYDQRARAEVSSGLVYQGQLQIASALANLYDNPQASAAVVRGAEGAAERMAMAIRNRYYQKEFEMVRKTRIAPIMQGFNDDLELFRQRQAIAVRPVMRTISAVQGQEVAETLQGGEPTIVEVPTGKTNAEGKPVGQPVPQAAPPAPNPALQPGRLGAVETYDALSIIDPLTGLPVDIDNSARFAEIKNLNANDYWNSYQKRSLELMDVLGEYAGNPFADEAGRRFYEHIANMAGFAATAELNPDKQIEVMNARAKAKAETEKLRAEAEQQQLLTGMRRGALEGQAPLVRSDIAAEPELLSSLGPRQQQIVQGQGAPPNVEEMAGLGTFASGTLERRKLEDARLTERRRSMAIPPELEGIPQNWEGHLVTRDERTSGLWKAHVQQHAATITSRLTGLVEAARSGNPAAESALRDAFKRVQAPDTVVSKVLAGNWQDPEVVKFTEQLAMADPKITQDATDQALLIRLPEVAREQPNVAYGLDQATDALITDLRARGYIVTPEMEALLRADRTHSALTYLHGGREPSAGLKRDPEEQARVNQAMTRINEQRSIDAAAIEQQNEGTRRAQWESDVNRLAILAPTPNVPGMGAAAEAPSPGAPIEAQPTNSGSDVPVEADIPKSPSDIPFSERLGLLAKPFRPVGTAGLPEVAKPATTLEQEASQFPHMSDEDLMEALNGNYAEDMKAAIRRTLEARLKLGRR